MALELPVGLRTSLESGSCVLFVGSGVGREALDSSGEHSPDSDALARKLAERFNIDGADAADLVRVSQVVELRRGREALELAIREAVSGFEPTEDLKWLFGLTWKAIFTTNYDRLIERCYELLESPTQTPVPVSSTADLAIYDPLFQVPVFHLHGSLFSGERPFALITETDYARFREHRSMLFEIFKTMFATAPVLYVGYSNRDPNWRSVTTELREEFLPSQPPTSYRVAPVTDPLDREILEAQAIYTVDADLEAFRELVQSTLGELHVEPHKLDSLESQVPADLRNAFRETPAPILRLLNSWSYLNQEDFNQTPNATEFLEGNLPSWSLIAHGVQFARDLEEEIFDDLVDFATSPNARPRMLAVLGPAGYGTSTVLMSLAVRLVQEQAGTVFFQRRGSQVLASDIEFASHLGLGPTFFVADNAADSIDELSTALSRLREGGSSACLLAGERLNEWRQVRHPVPAREYALDPLSDSEIYRLIECLERNGALGVLAELDQGLRFAQIKQRHRSQLLVAMKEATEGRAFEAIIEDEFRGIITEYAQRLYAYVCAFYRLGQPVRDSLLAKLLDSPMSELYGETADATEGVVYWDLIDASNEIYAARARHETIAAMVWERCLDPAEREQYILEAMNALNLHFASDARAFDRFVRSDETLASVQSIESKIEFFEVACLKYPDSPFVRQHYARMLRKEDRLDAALGQIDLAIDMAPRSRVLYHTRGVVLASMAEKNPSAEIARRRVVQAESAFRQTISMDPRDEYGYHGLAGLYFEWAQRAPTQDESAEYLRKAEETISTGLRTTREKERLWILSADVASWLGNKPDAIDALERAVQVAPGGIVGRYLLGREYLDLGEPERALETLRPVIENEPGEYRSGLVYALALHRLGKPLGESIAILQLGAFYGSRDPRFAATLGGMMFMSRQFDEAHRIFLLATQSGFRSNQRNRVFFIPVDSTGSPVRLSGRVTNVHLSYAFVRVPDFPDFFLHGSRLDGTSIVRDLKIVFSPGFSPRGPEATNAEVVHG